jgi:pSer/pThr/pTyr-binding forkhead associated (FHA) protein
VRFRIRSGAVKTVGRAARADIIVDVGLVSRLHCRLEAGADRIDVVDLSSTNGTFVNDARIERAQLAHGDRLRVGRLELQVEHVAGGVPDGGFSDVEETDSSGAPDRSS